MPPRQEQDNDWDDTDLLKVWEDCVAEYKKYHSIAREGGTIVTEDDAKEEPKVKEPLAGKAKEPAVNTQPTTAGILMPPLPSGMTEHMKSLALSWYYAGYYAGLAEGYNKAWAEGGEGS